MATTLTFGLVRPDTGDKGNVWFPALEDNITQLDAHTHDGVTSPQIPSSSIQPTVVNVDTTGWSATGNGFFTKNVTFPGSYLNSTSQIRFLLDGGTKDRNEIFPTYDLIDDTNMTITLPTNTQALNVIFS